MYLIILLSVVVIISALLNKICDNKWGSFSGASDVVGTIKVTSIIILIIAIILIPICRYNSSARIEEYTVRKETIEIQRENASEFERVQLTQEIIDDNAWLRKQQHHYKNNWLNIYIDEDVMNLEIIK